MNQIIGNFKLIWTNPNPSSEFDSQTIESDLSKYDYVLIETAYTAAYQGYYPETQYSFIPIGTSGHIMGVDDSVAFHATRTVNVSNTGINFSQADVFGYTLNSTINSIAYAIPLKIYAVKE